MKITNFNLHFNVQPSPRAQEESKSNIQEFANELNDKNLEKKGVLLNPIGSTQNGVVVFSLTDIPLKTIFKTEKNFLLQRTTSSNLIITNPNQTEQTVVKIVEDSPNPILLNDLEFELLSDPLKLKSQGIMLKSSFDAPRKYYSLSELRKHLPYFTPTEMVLVRLSSNELSYGKNPPRKIFIYSEELGADIIHSTFAEIKETHIPKYMPMTTLDQKTSSDNMKDKARYPTQFVTPKSNLSKYQAAPPKGIVDISSIDSVQFEVFTKILGGKAAKRTILLSKEKIKVRRQKQTLVKEQLGYFMAIPDPDDGRQFTLVIKRKCYLFVALSQIQRDEIIRTIKTFAENQLRKPSE